jgi:hypothetical protein
MRTEVDVKWEGANVVYPWRAGSEANLAGFYVAEDDKESCPNRERLRTGIPPCGLAVVAPSSDLGPINVIGN